MDRLIRKLSTSPKARQKLVIGNAKIFGVPLRYLTNSTEGQRVPRLVSNICRCLVQNGLQLQGIFRINGGVRLIESLKRQFQSSNANLNLDRMTSSTELYALAGVLKLFLREVPGGVVPKDITTMFIQVLGELTDSQSVDLTRLEELVLQLPEENAYLLHYVCHFLATVAAHEPVNKMSAEGLGILFGPCVFHCNLQVQVS
ncbi:RhoGAP domain protein [Paragonimus heterotremus]|uniref:RhoGAP domain protein n=1 Tax=Paragonimus heterotremus TaxID=100268 RepID=A0A8J4WUF5_9TREM|nr:RhoGAP domain protein [Paragonimus heterotremus]